MLHLLHQVLGRTGDETTALLLRFALFTLFQLRLPVVRLGAQLAIESAGQQQTAQRQDQEYSSAPRESAAVLIIEPELCHQAHPLNATAKRVSGSGARPAWSSGCNFQNFQRVLFGNS